MIRLLRARIGAIQDQGRLVAELKAVSPTEGISLSRWSRLKRAAGEAGSANAVRPEPVEGLVASEKANDRLSQNGNVDAISTSDEFAELPPISAISLAEDFTPFMQAKVPQALKQQALKALFKEPHFNVMDGLDIYIDDYTVFEPISPEVMATLSSWKTIMNPLEQVVTDGGYAVDVESEEGKAVLAARAELAQANAALQPSEGGGLEVPAPAARERAEAGDVAQSTSQTIYSSAVDDTLQLSDEANATALAPTPAQTCALARDRAAGKGAKPHLRYGIRVGDFSASSYAATEQPLLEPADADPAEAASTAPKSITQ